MAKQDTGGPAFPRTGFYPDTSSCRGDIDSLRERLPTVAEPQNGMTLRDYFAGQALMGFVCNSDIPDLIRGGFKPEGAGDACYLIADAMLKARSK